MDLYGLKKFEKIYPLFIKKFEDFTPAPDNADITVKINSLISYLNSVGRLTNDVVTDWNNVMTWALNEGLKEATDDKIDDLISSGKLPELVEPFVNEITSLAEEQISLIETNQVATKSDFNNVSEQLQNKANESDLQKLQNDLTGLHKLDYKSVSVHVGLNGYKKPDMTIWNHLKTQGASATLIVMVGLNSATDDNPQMINDSIIQETINDADSIGVNISMIKLHLGVGFSDGFNRGNYLPTSINTYFDNWKTICNHYADLCNQYSIPILCIGCEQPNQTQNQYLSKWNEIVSQIKSIHPNLLLTYAPKTWEIQSTQYQDINGLLDIIGYNVYLSYTQKKLSEETPKENELAKSFWWQNDGINVVDTMSDLYERFNKPIFITEIGCMPIDNGLTNVVPPNYESEPQNYDAVYWLMKISFDILFRETNVIGFAWWSAEPPFTYFNDNTITSAEQIMIDYVKGGLI